MLERLRGAWRLLGTTCSFLGFGLGGLLLRGVVFPLVNLSTYDPPRRARRAKAVVHHAFRLLVGVLQRIGVLSLELRNIDALQQQGLLIVANHPSLLDIVFLLAQVPQGDCLVKSALRDNPFTAGPVRAAGYICNDRGLDIIQQCVHSVRDERNSLVIFPEGTRSTADEAALPLRRGAAHIAIAGRIDLTPVWIDCHPPFLARGQKWYKLTHRRPHVVIDVRPPIAVLPFLEPGVSDGIAARRLTTHLANYFSEGRSYARAGRRD